MSKLTLSVDSRVVSRAKVYAKRQGLSISKMVEIYLAAEHLQRRLEQHDGGGAVHVIIAIDQDQFLAGDGRLHPRDRLGHALHGVGIEQVFDAGMKENIGFGSAAYPALRQQLGYDER